MKIYWQPSTSGGKEESMFRAAFACSTIFHYEHLKRIARKCTEVKFIIFTPVESESTLKLKEHLEQNEERFCHISEFLKNNQSADVLFSVFWQPSFSMLGTNILHARVMYGYAKDDWNYGEWNKNYDVIFTYGPYANEKLNHLAICVQSGHPRGPAITDSSYKTTTIGGPRIRTSILYCPTYGDLSSMSEFDEVIPTLLKEGYSLTIKLHHLNDYKFYSNIMHFHNIQEIQIFDESKDLFDILPSYDLIISDHSGAIFDAMLLEKKILLIDSKNLRDRILTDMNDESASLDIAIRHCIPHCAIEHLPKCIAQTLQQPIDYHHMLPRLFAGRGTDVAQMIHYETERLLKTFGQQNKQTDLNHRFHQFIQCDGRRIVICGAGDFGQSVAYKLSTMLAKAVSFIDADHSKQNTYIDGIPVNSVEDLTNMSPETHKVIIATVGGSQFFENNLHSAGFTKNDDYLLAF